MEGVVLHAAVFILFYILIFYFPLQLIIHILLMTYTEGTFGALFSQCINISLHRCSCECMLDISAGAAEIFLMSQLIAQIKG